jgi:hypothetical protein
MPGVPAIRDRGRPARTASEGNPSWAFQHGTPVVGFAALNPPYKNCMLIDKIWFL